MGDWSLTFNITDEVYAQLSEMIEAYRDIMDDYENVMWFEVYSPFLTNAFYVIAQPPLQIPLPEISQNELQTVELTLSISEYKGMMTAVKPTIA